MTLVEKYEIYRKINKELNNKIMKFFVNHDVFEKSARLLGIFHGGKIIFDSKDEISSFMDFTLNEHIVDNKSILEIYQEKIGWQNEIEKNVLDALLISHTSLFKITSIQKLQNTVILKDILNKTDNIKLIDTGLSKTAIVDFLLFIRLVSFKNFNMTSGALFAFPGNLEKYLLNKYKKLSKRIKSDSDSVKRFVSFFKLNKTDGIEVRYL